MHENYPQDNLLLRGEPRRVGPTTVIRAVYKMEYTRANKKPFGAIHKIAKIDEDIIQIFNKESEVLYVEVKRLSPLIDTDESRLKNALTDLKVKPTDELVNSMSQLVAKVSITNVANSP